ncbi:MAG: hypothetical protein ACYC4U_22720 [Pirellulaceae bacterium]
MAKTNSICSVSQLTELVARDANALDPLPAHFSRFPGDTLPPPGSRAQQIEHLLEYVSPPASVQLQTIANRRECRGDDTRLLPPQLATSLPFILCCSGAGVCMLCDPNMVRAGREQSDRIAGGPTR